MLGINGGWRACSCHMHCQGLLACMHRAQPAAARRLTLPLDADDGQLDVVYAFKDGSTFAILNLANRNSKEHPLLPVQASKVFLSAAATVVSSGWTP